jgi:D-alanyl-D-alanine carboxypeptidase/D-alanyl-D-alanine-endopeptidase (penicillin-binding protein 4)
MLPFVREKIRRFPLSGGRCTFSHDRRDTALYAGGLLRYFLERRGVGVSGVVRPGFIGPADRLILTYQSRRTLQEVLKEMLEYSSNFTANQILVAMGARVYGPPGTLAKGVRVVSDYARKQLQLKHLKMVEGSGISRENRISALDMLAVLNGFRPYRHLLRRDGPLIYKTGTLKGIRARSGYMDGADGGLYEFAIFLNQSGGKVHDLLECLKRSIGPPDFTPPG